MPNRFQTIVHPTDFSDLSVDALAHALRDKLGIKVAKVSLTPQNPLRELLYFLDQHPSDLIVLATHGRDGISHWLQGSIAEKLSRAARLPTLFVPPTACGFVEQSNGEVRLSRVLVPVDHSPPATEALGVGEEFLGLMNGQGATIELMHVGETAPSIRRGTDGALVPVTIRTGDAVSTILQSAEEQQADLIAMPTAGHRSFLDATLGSTTERVTRHAPCPVLTVPAQ
jgi:nucleotide-binding universal stress UspA family protein